MNKPLSLSEELSPPETSKAGQAARTPAPARGRELFETILSAAETLLAERGSDGLSIPELASRLSCTRTSIYHFFPTPYAILNELTRRYLQRLEDEVAELAIGTTGRPWREVINDVASLVARFYNRHPVAGMLVLGAVASSESHQALQLSIAHLGHHVDALMREAGVVLPNREPNATALTVELGTACLRLSYYLHGEVTEVYQRECAEAMIRQLQRYTGD
ncbi:MAG: TetR/AcrR family transcriptional regulator [Spongiibacter sp.]|uniref:TetR/AcrR family transcriptional regulator n=1 Tax=Spongiibacter sp. TaxID=2024860 RepID=UPI001B09FB98|nr:TetR/AcrR family transcriptional regulator [Spongiibacter sp.]MBO6753039.1 TetR/AcrR family transcriptional regulator [Spongiibacter sp.]